MSWREFWRMLRRPLPLMAVLGAALGIFLVGGATYSDERGLFGEISAAWVQAVGSIAAIVAAAWIAAHQSREAINREERARIVALERDRDALQAKRSSVIGLCEELVRVASNASDRLQSGGSEQIRSLAGSPMDILRSMEVSLAAFPFEALESSDGAASLLKMRTLVPELLIQMDGLVAAARRHDEASFAAQRTHFIQHASHLRKEHQTLKTALGFSPSKGVA